MVKAARTFAALAAALLIASGARAAEPNAPEAPRAFVEIPPLKTAGRTIRVPAGGDLQKALDEAKSGDRIELEPRATYEGPFHLKAKDGDDWIVVASAGAVPKPGRHVQPSEAASMAKLVSSGDFVVVTDPGAHHYRFVAIEFAPKAGAFVSSLLQFGDKEASADQVPHHLIVDRSYLHGDPKIGARRGVALNAREAAVIDSYFADFKEVGADSQAIGGWNGPGPFRIANNYLEAAGENIMFGGADPKIADLVPSDIEIVHNHLTKPLRWRKGDPSFDGVEWTVKNLFELKNARRVVVNGNLLEYNWPQAQNGFAILFTVRNQDGGAPWSTIEDVSFTNNLVRHVAAGVNMLGRDDNNPSQQAKRIAIRNNVFLDVGGKWGPGRLFQMLDGVSGVTIDHNTAFHTGGILFGGDHAPHTGFAFQNNVVMLNEVGVIGSSAGEGNDSLKRYFPDAVFRRNVIVGGVAGRYPTDNFFPASLQDAGLTIPRDQDFRLTLVRPYSRAATDGRDPGADVDAVAKALDGLEAAGLRTRARAQASVIGVVLLWTPGAGVVFWVSLALLVYVYIGYPLVAALRARLWARPRLRAPIEPSISIVVMAHNEAERIGPRIENLLALDYPRDKVEIVIGSDGSTDDTVQRALSYADRGVTVCAFTQHRGKPATINAVVPMVHGDLVVFADARQRFEPQAIRELVANFADPAVGAASGELVLAAHDGTAAAGHGTAFYWRYEKFIRSTEGRADSTIGATGAIYAIRRDLFEPIPDDTLLDDVLIPLRIVRRGYRVVFEPNARALDRASSTARQEFVRKTRTIAGMFQLIAREGWLLNPLRNRLWFETISHKVLRLALPMLHASWLLSNVALADSGFYGLMLTLQVVFYGAAAIGLSHGDGKRRSIVFSAPAAICLLLWATVIGFFRFVTNRQQVTWERVAAPAARDLAV
ncbi:MAG TPA: glycosyltransferase family 2 protein [Vicinamibacterales bacterium]|jgi:cellulose synthase/poly-beta-1,6-N-acetylglucosamine synthase-like glycosyltransferase